MNYFNFLEYVKINHTDAQDKHVNMLLNSAADDFCRRTEVYKPVYSEASVAGQRYYSLPSASMKILKVQINDVTIARLLTPPQIDDDEFGVTSTDVTEDTALSAPSSSSDERYWYIDLDRIGIVEQSINSVTRVGKTSDLQSMSESGKEIRIFTIATPTHFDTASHSYTSDNQALFGEIPAMFHDALVYKVCSRLYEGDIETLKLAEHFRDKCMRIVREAKQYVKSNKTQGGYIKPHYF